MPERKRQLKITEIFHSLQGEADSVGWPTTFVRLTGCPLRCTWCDTPYSFHGGHWRTFDEIIHQARENGTPRVCVTGGEPLAQKRCLPFLVELCDADFEVSVETSGAVDVGQVDSRVRKVMDLKAPGSGEVDRNLWSNLAHLNAGDEIKIVIADEDDYVWARQMLSERKLARHAPVIFSPVHEALNPADLANWILRDGLNVRLGVQLHKYLWGDEPGR